MQHERFQLLSLSGGGYRGLYTAAALFALENSAKRPLGQCFELIAGTSIGGIIALAIAFEVPMAKVLKAFQDSGPSIFPKKRPPPTSKVREVVRAYQEYAKPTACAKAVREVVEGLIGRGARLGDATHAVVLPAVNLTEGRPQVFKTRHYAGIERDPMLPAVDIALATSAAPTFFPPVRLANCLYADGGLIANSPDLVALHEAMFFLNVAPTCLHMLSVGTTTAKYSIVDSEDNTYGTKFWVIDQERRLPNVLISAQQQFAEQIAAHVLGKRYIRLDTVPSHEQAPHLGLDKVTDTATRTLLGLGGKAGTDACGTVAVQELLRHIAANVLLRGGGNGAGRQPIL